MTESKTTRDDAKKAGLRCNCPGDYWENGGHNIYCPLGVESVVRDVMLSELAKEHNDGPTETKG